MRPRTHLNHTDPADTPYRITSPIFEHTGLQNTTFSDMAVF